MRTAVGVCLRSGYALPSPHTHSGVSSRLTGNLILIVAQHSDIQSLGRIPSLGAQGLLQLFQEVDGPGQVE